MKLDQVYNHTSEDMHEIEHDSVQLVVTSPPYNAGIDYDTYDDWRPKDEYLAMLNRVWAECDRVLVRGGRIAVNIADTGRQPYFPLHSVVTQQLRDLGFIMRGTIIWDKGLSGAQTTAWGSFGRCSNPVLRDIHEYILLFSKDSLTLEKTNGKHSGIKAIDFIKWRNSVWHMHTSSTKKHPAVFPYELPKRLILFNTNFDDVVLDPFGGIGTTARAAQQLRRRYLMYEISPNYVVEALSRLAMPQFMGFESYEFEEAPEKVNEEEVAEIELAYERQLNLF